MGSSVSVNNNSESEKNTHKIRYYRSRGQTVSYKSSQPLKKQVTQFSRDTLNIIKVCKSDSKYNKLENIDISCLSLFNKDNYDKQDTEKLLKIVEIAKEERNDAIIHSIRTIVNKNKTQNYWKTKYFKERIKTNRIWKSYCELKFSFIY